MHLYIVKVIILLNRNDIENKARNTSTLAKNLKMQRPTIHVITHLPTSQTRKWAERSGGFERGTAIDIVFVRQLCLEALEPAIFLSTPRTCHENPKRNITVSLPFPSLAHTRRDTPSTKWQQGLVYLHLYSSNSPLCWLCLITTKVDLPVHHLIHVVTQHRFHALNHWFMWSHQSKIKWLCRVIHL